LHLLLARPEWRAYACMTLLFLNSIIASVLLLSGNEIGFLTFWLGALIIPIFFQLRISKESFEQFGFWIRGMPKYLVFGIILSLCLVIIHIGIELAVGGLLLSITEDSIVLFPAMVVTQIFVSIIEEMNFRGYIQRNLSIRYSPKVSISIASLFFGLGHWINFLIVLNRSLISLLLFGVNMVIGGVFLGYAYYRSSNNLWLPIALHFSWNLFGYFFFSPDTTTYLITPIFVEFEWSILTALILLFGTVVIHLFSKTSLFLSIVQEDSR
jgi:membrane protease YdiL (CAAX protease family)